MGQFTCLSLQALVALFCLPLSSVANNLLLRNGCEAVSPIVVTYTTTVYATKEAAPDSPSVTTEGSIYNPSVSPHGADYTATHRVDYTHALSQNPHPVPVEYESCFNRSSTIEYPHSSYDHYYPSEIKTSYPANGGGYHSLPIYGKPNATLTKFYPTASRASSTISLSENTTVPTQSCTPTIELDGVIEDGYNKKGAPFSVKIASCSKFQLNQTTAFANFRAIPGMTVSEDSISFSGFSDDYCLLSVFALDTNGYPIIKSWELHFGSINMPVLILNPDDSPAEGVHVEANATVYPGLTGGCMTNALGKCTIENLPGTTIGLVARKNDNSIAVNGLAPTTVQVTLKLLPFIIPKPGASFDVDNGTAGWTGGTLQQSLKIKRDTTLVVNTNGQYTLQSSTNSFPASEGIKKAYIRYRFITSEIPGGFFG